MCSHGDDRYRRAVVTRLERQPLAGQPRIRAGCPQKETRQYKPVPRDDRLGSGRLIWSLLDSFVVDDGAVD